MTERQSSIGKQQAQRHANLRERRIGLAMSGGGFRSTLFQLGGAWRLHDLGLLRRLDTIGAVSGGAITAAWIAAKWDILYATPPPHPDDGAEKPDTLDRGSGAASFREVIARPLMEFCGEDLDGVEPVDVRTFVKGALMPMRTFRWQQRLEALFESMLLSELPADAPRTLIQASNLLSGGGVFFSRDLVEDTELGLNRSMPGSTLLSTALTASCAFPSWFLPVQKDASRSEWEPHASSGSGTKAVHAERERKRKVWRFGSKMLLADGGMFDNLGVAALWKSQDYVLISDAAIPLKPGFAEDFTAFFIDKLKQPLSMVFGTGESLWRRFAMEQFKATDFVTQVLNQSRLAVDCLDQYHQSHREKLTGKLAALRERARQEEYRGLPLGGAYWSVRSRLSHYAGVETAFGDSAESAALSATPTSLNAVVALRRQQLVNWGYILADLALRAQLDATLPVAGQSEVPFPDAVI